MADSATAAAPYPVLYSFRRCPYAMRGRLALVASGTICELREVVLARKPAALLQASPKATVPVMVLPDGAVLEQSLDIMLWALRRNDPLHWLPTSEQGMADVLQLIGQCDGDFKAQLDRYKYPSRYALPDGLSHRAQGAQFLDMLNTRLASHRHLMGEHFSLADAAIAPFVRQYAHTDPTWFASQDWPDLQQWLTAFEASGDYAKVMEKFTAWTEGQSMSLFPV
jgi:glutathione S-transferase